MLEEYPDVLTAREVREILYLGRNKVYELLETGVIKGVKIGRDWRVAKVEITSFFGVND